MRKFLAALMAVFMLTAALAVLPASAAATVSTKDGSTAADAEAIDLVVTEVLADTKSNNVSMATKNAFQYIEVYNRGNTTVNLYDYAIVRATYDEKNKGTQWADPKKFDKKIVLDDGSIYAPYAGMTGISGYDTSTLACINRAGEDALAPGETALIWIWNKDTKDVFGANGGTAATGENAGTMGAFRKHYKDMGAEIPAGVKIIAAFGVDGIGQSCDLNVTKNYIYALVDDTANFDVSVEVAYSKSVGGEFTRNSKIECMFKFGTSLGYYTTNENYGAVYTLASKTPYFTNAYLDNTDADYYASEAVDGYTEMACIYYDEPMNPGKLLPVQWADLDPARAPADVKGTDANWATTAWNTYVTALVALNGGGEGSSGAEDDLGQGNIDVNRDDLGNLGQNKAGEWTFVTWVDEETGETKYGRYKTDGGSMDTVVEIDKETYDKAMAALAEMENEGDGFAIWQILLFFVAPFVVVLGGAAVALIIVLKKKNKNVAADDVAGFVQIIDEGAAAPMAPVDPATGAPEMYAPQNNDNQNF